MVIHIFPRSKFLEPFVDFLYQNFDVSEHKIFCFDECGFQQSNEFRYNEFIIDIDEKADRWIVNELRKADKIIFHSLLLTIRLLFLFFCNRKLLRKSAWFIWGGDLYCYLQKRTHIKEHLVEYARKKVIQSMSVYATWIRQDVELVKKWYHGTAEYMSVAYYDKELSSELQNQHSKLLNNSEIKILVGNSATKTNHHREVFEIIRAKNLKNIKIYAPLSYGDKNYGDEIDALGRKYFGDSFVPLREYMSKEDYVSFLNDMDIVVFNHDRQQALGNIVAILYLGKKLYLRQTTTMWDSLVHDMGFKINTMEEFANMEIGEMLRQDKVICELNHEIAAKHYDKFIRVEEWNKLFHC